MPFPRTGDDLRANEQSSVAGHAVIACEATEMDGKAVDGVGMPRARRGRGRWASFVADSTPGGAAVRGLHEQTNPQHRPRVEHDAHTLLIHLSGEDGEGWTTIAVDRDSRRWAVAQDRRQATAASDAYEHVYGGE